VALLVLELASSGPLLITARALSELDLVSGRFRGFGMQAGASDPGFGFSPGTKEQ